MLTAIASGSRLEETASSTSVPPSDQQASGVGVKAWVECGVLVDQGVGEGSGGTVKVAVGGCGAGVGSGGAAHPASRVRRSSSKTFFMRLIIVG